MAKRTTIEIDEDLLARAKRALGAKTARATVEEALRRVEQAAENSGTERISNQRRYLHELKSRADVSVLASEEMWREPAGYSTRAPPPAPIIHPSVPSSTSWLVRFSAALSADCDSFNPRALPAVITSSRKTSM